MARSTVYNDNLTDDYDKVSPRNRRLVKEYIQYCKSNDKSPKTQQQYESWLKVFFCWNYRENGDKFFVDLKKRDFVYYFGYLRDLGMSPNRIASLKSCLSSLSTEIELLYEDEYPNFHNQLRGLEPVHITTVREKTVLSVEEVERMLKTLTDEKEYQIACYVALVCSCGARKSELLQMKTSFFTDENLVFDGYMYCTPQVRSKGRGKIGKLLKKYVIKELFDPYLKNWLEERKEKGIETDNLFVTEKDGQWVPATVSTANMFARRISKRFGIDFYTHSGRHFFCTYLKKMDLPDDIVVQIIGWNEKTGSTMVSIYDDTDKNEKIEKFFRSRSAGNEAKGE